MPASSRVKTSASDEEAAGGPSSAGRHDPAGGRPRRRLDRDRVAGRSPTRTPSATSCGCACTKPRAPLNYRPSRAARTLRVGTSQTVGVVIPDLQNPFFTGVVRGIDLVLQAAGYTLLLSNSDEDAARERNSPRDAAGRGGRGASSSCRSTTPRDAVYASCSRRRSRPWPSTASPSQPARRPGDRRQRRGHPDRRRAPAGARPSRRGAARRSVEAQHRHRTRAGLPQALQAAGLAGAAGAGLSRRLPRRRRLRRDEDAARAAPPSDGGVRRQQPDDARRVARAPRGRRPHPRRHGAGGLRRHAVGDVAESAADRDQPAVGRDRLVGRGSAARPHRAAGARGAARDPGNEAGRQDVVRRGAHRARRRIQKQDAGGARGGGPRERETTR